MARKSVGFLFFLLDVDEEKTGISNTKNLSAIHIYLERDFESRSEEREFGAGA